MFRLRKLPTVSAGCEPFGGMGWLYLTQFLSDLFLLEIRVFYVEFLLTLVKRRQSRMDSFVCVECLLKCISMLHER